MWSDNGGNYWPIWSACAVFVTQQVGCSRKKCSWLAHSLSLESRKTFPSTWSLLASPITTSCASAVPPAVTGSGVSTSRQQVCVADLPALKQYLSTWYYRMRATTKLTPANLFQLISSAFPFRSAAQVWFEGACTSIEETAAQPDEADTLLICTFAYSVNCKLLFAHYNNYLQGLITSQVAKSSSSMTCNSRRQVRALQLLPWWNLRSGKRSRGDDDQAVQNLVAAAHTSVDQHDGERWS